jgi:hypothetical protein
MSLDEKVSKEAKLAAARDIVASYLRGAAASGNQPDVKYITDLFSSVYDTIEKKLPEGEKRKVGLGL